MLTKDLITCRNERGKLRPKFIPDDQRQSLVLATEILAEFAVEQKKNRAEIEENTRELIDQWPDLRQAKGLLKIAMDLAEFAPTATMDYQEARKQALLEAAKMLRQKKFADEEQFRATLAARLPENQLLQQNALYADLPDNDLLQAFPDIDAQQLLQRYNCGLVQGLLLGAEEMRLELPEITTPKLRRLMQQLKFFRLLARIETSSSSVVSLVIDGPGSVLDQSRRYGLQLASFFPAVCNLPSWRLQARVVWQRRSHRLELDQSSGLVGHYRNVGTYLPEEIDMFAKKFRELSGDWRLIFGVSSLRVQSSGELIFPDFAFVHVSGRKVFLELFHRWHRGQLMRRLQQIATHPDWALAIGVDMAVAQNKEVQEHLETSEWFLEKGFTFRDYPTVEKTLRCLNAFLAEEN